MIRLACLLTAALLVTPVVSNPAHEESAAVHRAVQDYVEALYQVKPELIERSVHPALVKRGMWRPEGTTEYRLPGLMTFSQLRDLAANWNVNDQRGTDLTYEIELLDVMDQTASAKLSADWGVDHMQLMKREGRWMIVHVLWQSHPPAQAMEAGSER